MIEILLKNKGAVVFKIIKAESRLIRRDMLLELKAHIKNF